jgi:hypothetical protein
MKEEVNLPKLIKRIEKIRQGYWNFQGSLLSSSYRTSIEDRFDVSLDIKHKEGSSNPEDKEYSLSVALKYNFKHNSHPLTFSGKDVTNLCKIIDERYNKYIGKLKKEDDCSMIKILNELLEKE